jgi:hemerythrin
MPTWTPKYAVGHSLIDQQHQELFARADALLDAMHDGRAAAELGQLLQFLGTYVIEHFGTEERLMDAGKYAATAQHKAQHAEFVRRFQEDAETYRASGATSMVVLDLRDMLRGWLVTHICTVDMQLAAFLRTGKVSAG